MPEDARQHNYLKALNLAAEWATMATSDNTIPESRTLRPIIRFIAIALMATSLSACETVGTEDKKVEVAQPMSDTELKQTYNDAMKNTADGSVQVFSLDDSDMSVPYQGGVDPLTPVGSNLPQGVGKPFGGDSNVMVFSLDGPSAAPAARGDIPQMIPPGGPMSLTPTPFDPAQAGGDGVSRIYFSHGGLNLNAAGKEVTSFVTDKCKAGGCGVVKVEGHASTRAEAKDEIQRRLINLKVSMDRAMNVSRQLIRSGVSADAIQVTAHGDRVPPVVVPGGDTEAAARRVEIITAPASPLMY